MNFTQDNIETLHQRVHSGMWSDLSLFVLETRIIHIPVKTEETQRLRIKCVPYCPICAQLENQTS